MNSDSGYTRTPFELDGDSGLGVGSTGREQTLGGAMASNHVLVERSAFIDALRVYGEKRAKLGPVLLSFDGGILMVESGGIAKAMSAEGQ